MTSPVKDLFSHLVRITEMFSHELLVTNNLPEGCPELNWHDAEENEVDRAVQQSHHVHHLTKLEQNTGVTKTFQKKCRFVSSFRFK